MLRTFQKYRRSILGLVTVGMVGLAMSGFGVNFLQPSREPYAIKIDDHSISFSDFEHEKRNIEERYRQMMGQNWGQFAEEIRKNLGSQATDSLISEYLLRREAQNAGLFAGDESVRNIIRSELFPQGFNPEQYSAYLRMRGMTSAMFENELRNFALRSQITNLIEDSTVISKREAKAALISQQTSYDISYVEFDPVQYMDQAPAPSDEAIDNYYNEHSSDFELPARVAYDYAILNPKDFLSLVEVTPDDIEIEYTDNESQYQTPEEIKVRHIQFTVPAGATTDQIVAIKEKAREVHAKAVGAPPQHSSDSAADSAMPEQLASGKGEDFASLATRYSDDVATSVNGGDLGWVARGKMDPAFDKAAFSLRPGAVSDIIEVPYGFHLIKVEEKREPRQKTIDEVRDEIVKAIQVREAPAYTRAKADDLLLEWEKGKDDLTTFAASHKLTAASTISAFDSTQDPEGLPGLTEQVLGNVDTAKQLLDLGESSILVQVREYKEPEIAPLSQVKEKIVTTLKEQAAKRLAKDKAQEILARLQEGAGEHKVTLNEVASKEKIKVQESKGVTSAQLTGALADNAIRTAITSTGEALAVPAQVFQVEKKDVIFQVTSIKRPLEADLSDKIKQQMETERSRSSQLLMSSLISTLKANSKIDINSGIMSY